MNLRRTLGRALITSQDLTNPADPMRVMSQQARSHTAEVRHATSGPHAVSGLVELASHVPLR